MRSKKFLLASIPLKTSVALALAACLAGSPPAAAASNPFRSFVGQWSGSGQMVGSNGHKGGDPLPAEDSEAKGGEALNRRSHAPAKAKLDIESHR